MCSPKGPVVSNTFGFHFLKTLLLSHVCRRDGVVKPCVQRLFKFCPQTLSYRSVLPFLSCYTHLLQCVQYDTYNLLFVKSVMLGYGYSASLKEGCR